MTDTSWVLKGVDANLREQAAAEANRLGMSLGDYLTDVVLKSAIVDQVSGLTEAEPTHSEPEDNAIFAPPPESHEGYAIRQRLKSLERRLSAAVASLDGAHHSLDSSLFDVTARVGEVESLAGDTAHALGKTQQEINNTVTGLQIHLAVIEDNIGDLGHMVDERAAGIDLYIGQVEHIARGAERSASVLADAHEALKHAVADDFIAFTHETIDRLNGGLADVRAAADVAAEQADAAVTHLIAELRGVRQALDERVIESAAETRARMHAAFNDAADRMSALSERVTDNERFTNRVTEQLRAQIADAEDGAQTALEETASGLRQANTVLAADISRAKQENHAALENTRASLAAEIVAVRDDQMSQLARLKLVDVAVGNTINELGVLRDTIEQRIRQGESATGAALDNVERDTLQLRQTLLVEIERVETCTFAALEKLGRDIAGGNADAHQQIVQTALSLRAELERAREQSAADISLLREEHAGALARLTLLDGALSRVEAAAAPVDARLARVEASLAAFDPEIENRIAQLEHAAASAESEHAIAIIRDDVATLAQRLDALRADSTLADRLAALQSQLEAQAAQSGGFNDQLQGVARMLNRVAAQNVEGAAKAEDRAHQIEVAMADLRLQQLSASESTASSSLISSFEQRIAAFEDLQAETLHRLRNDVAAFVSENDRRLATLEEPSTDRDLAKDFETLRARMEERIIGVETRSIRTLEQVADTVQMLEQRFIQAGADADDKAARSA